jgi:hypothetical protein
MSEEKEKSENEKIRENTEKWFKIGKVTGYGPFGDKK